MVADCAAAVGRAAVMNEGGRDVRRKARGGSWDEMEKCPASGRRHAEQTPPIITTKVNPRAFPCHLNNSN
jgi:hypothetical protein